LVSSRSAVFFGVRPGVVFSLGSVPRWYFLSGPFRGYISLLASGVVTGREESLLL
jgi:hypothetical protein